jgi:glycosyltransferase involved in cell wall biosynthesis
MKATVIIPTYNEEKVILECLKSLDKQFYKDFEVIVVDDGSTDSTLDNISNFKPQKYKLTVLKQLHKGPAMARNLGAKHAKGKILVFVDADMSFSRDFLQNLVKPIEQKQTTGTFSTEEYVSNWNNVWARCWNINSNLPEKRRLPLNYSDHQKVFRAILKSEFDKVNGFSKGGYTDDWTLSEKLGYEAVNAPDAIFYHKNPDTLKEVYKQAKWIGKREYKFGILGTMFALVRSSFPISLIAGLFKAKGEFGIPFHRDALRYDQFVVFKLVYDFGIFVGILEMIITKKTAK